MDCLKKWNEIKSLGYTIKPSNYWAKYDYQDGIYEIVKEKENKLLVDAININRRHLLDLETKLSVRSDMIVSKLQEFFEDEKIISLKYQKSI